MSEEHASYVFKTIPEVDSAGTSKIVVPICHTACITYQKNVNPSFTVLTSMVCVCFISGHKEFVINKKFYTKYI
jgi:hypothetical protein